MSARLLASACGFFVASISDAQAPAVSGVEVSPVSGGGVLRLAWDDRMFWIPFRTRQ